MGFIYGQGYEYCNKTLVLSDSLVYCKHKHYSAIRHASCYSTTPGSIKASKAYSSQVWLELTPPKASSLTLESLTVCVPCKKDGSRSVAVVMGVESKRLPTRMSGCSHPYWQHNRRSLCLAAVLPADRCNQRNRPQGDNVI